MSDLDREMSYFLASSGASKKVQLRTRYLDDVLELSTQGYSDDEIDKLLLSKFIKESPDEAAAFVNDGMLRTEVEKKIKDAGMNLDEMSEKEIKHLHDMANLVTNFNTQKKFQNKQTHSWWRRKSKFFRTWIFGSITWGILVLLYVNIFEPYGHRLNSDEEIQVTFIMLIPLLGGAIKYLHDKFVK